MPWGVLGLAPTADLAAIRRAYAALIRQFRPDSHPLEFARIREAYELAAELSKDTGSAEEWLDSAPAWPREAEPRRPAPPAHDASPVSVESAGPGGEPVVIPAPVFDLSGAAEAGAPPALDAQALVDELVARAGQTEAEPARTLLLEQLRRCAQATIDERLDYEWLLLRALLWHERPPLPLVFDAGRLLHWDRWGPEVRRQWGAQASTRLAVLLEMAASLVFATRFSRNAWDRRLFAPQEQEAPWFAAAPLLEAQRTRIVLWQHWCTVAGLPGLAGLLNASVLRRVSGQVLLSTDGLLGLLVGGLVALGGHPWSAVVGGSLAAVAVVVAARRAAGWFRSLPPEGRVAAAVGRVPRRARWATAVLACAVGWWAVSAAFRTWPSMDPLGLVLVPALLALVALVGAGVAAVAAQAWNVLRMVEGGAYEVLRWPGERSAQRAFAALFETPAGDGRRPS